MDLYVKHITFKWKMGFKEPWWPTQIYWIMCAGRKGSILRVFNPWMQVFRNMAFGRVGMINCLSFMTSSYLTLAVLIMQSI